MTRKILILPYFGNFNNYFDLWLYSCACNPTIDWLIITDNPAPLNLPTNISWQQKSFNEIKNSFQHKFDFKICLDSPYKLCDYKGFYGYLFSEEIQGYDFWGYCDCDLIFGDIAAFLPEQIFQSYDKIFTKGHLSFIRNTPAINLNFTKYETYKIALTTPIIYGYDEAIDGYHKGLSGELIDQGYKVFCSNMPIDVDFRYFPFHNSSQSHAPCIFSFENGQLFKIVNLYNTIKKEEIIYAHLQKRKMTVHTALDYNRVLIYPNVISPYSEALLTDPSFWASVTTEIEGYFNFLQERLALWKRDILRVLHEPSKIRCITYRIKTMLKK